MQRPEAIERERKLIADRLPGDPDALWQWCLNRSREELLDLLAIIAAKSVNAVQRKGDKPDAYRLMHAADLAKALRIDIGGPRLRTTSTVSTAHRSSLRSTRPRASTRPRSTSSRNPSLPSGLKA